MAKKTLQQQLDDERATIVRLRDEISTLKTERGTEAGKADRYREGLESLKNEHASLLDQFNRLQGYLDRVREQEAPEERRHADRRRPVEFNHDPFDLINRGHQNYDSFGNKMSLPKRWFNR